MHIDVNDNYDDEEQEPEYKAIIAYVEGSYFGDSDIFFQDKNQGRDTTAIAESECHLLVLKRKDLLALVEDFHEIGKEMK